MTRTKNLLLIGTIIPAIVLSQGSFAAPSLQLAQAQSGDDDKPDPRRQRPGGQERPAPGGQERPGARPAPGQPPGARPAAPERPAGAAPSAPRPPSAPQAAPPTNRAEPEQPRRPTPPAGAAPGQTAPQRPAPGQIAPPTSPARPSAPPAQTAPSQPPATAPSSPSRPAPGQTAPGSSGQSQPSQPAGRAPGALSQPGTAPSQPAPSQQRPSLNGQPGQPSAAPPAGRTPGALSQPGAAPSQPAPSQQPGLNRQPGQAAPSQPAPGQPSTAPNAGRAPGALSQPGTAPSQPAPTQPQQPSGLSRQPGQTAPGQTAPTQPAPGQGALGTGQPATGQPAPAPNTGRAPGALSQPGTAPSQTAPAPGQQPGTLSQPGVAPGQAQPQPGVPGQPAPDRQGRRGGIGLGGAAAIGLGAAAIGGIMATQGASRLDDIRSRREERREGDVTIIREPGRTIIRGDDDRVIIRRDETQRFRDLGLDTRSERRGEETVTVYDRPDGTQIVTVTDAEGRLIRRSRRERDGGEFVIIDNVRRDGPQARFAEEVVELPPPQLRIPRERYIVDAERADERLIYETITAPPVAPVPRRYTLDEVRYSPDLRAHMRSVDIDTINFDSGSWTVTPDQAGRLRVIAQAVRQAVERAPNEVFMVEGHTDAVGSDVDNISLSDRRAQSVAEILTRDFAIPAENLTTQGYGEQYLKIQTQGDSRENRRVTLRRITPLLTGQNQQ
jgi:outer membrane protein OmpA-like peptidoglycan-associated protein